MEKILTDIERQALAEKASKLHSLPIGLFDAYTDHGLRVMADDLSDDEWEESERNSDWIEEMEDAQRREENPISNLIAPPRAPSSLDAYASSDHRTATEMALDYVKSLEQQD